MRNVYRSPDRAKNIYNEIQTHTKTKSEIFIAFEWCYTQVVQYGDLIHVYVATMETIKSNMGCWSSGYSAVTNLKLPTLCLKIKLMLQLEVREAVSHGGRIGLGWYWPVPIIVLHTCGVCKSEVTWVAWAQAPPSKFDKKKNYPIYYIREKACNSYVFLLSSVGS